MDSLSLFINREIIERERKGEARQVRQGDTERYRYKEKNKMTGGGGVRGRDNHIHPWGVGGMVSGY